MKNKDKVLAIFDFDKTITAKHTFIRFFQYVSGSSRFYLNMISLIPHMIRYKTGSINLMNLREVAIEKFFYGLSEDKYLKYCDSFVEEYINNWLLEEAINRIKWHKSQNHTLVLLSNSPEDYLKPWAKQFEFDYVMGSRFEFVSGKSTGKIKGDHCFGSGKVKRLKAVFGDPNDYYIYGYGDSEGDLEFLNLSDKAFYKFFDLKKIYNQAL